MKTEKRAFSQIKIMFSCRTPCVSVYYGIYLPSLNEHNERFFFQLIQKYVSVLSFHGWHSVAMYFSVENPVGFQSIPDPINITHLSIYTCHLYKAEDVNFGDYTIMIASMWIKWKHPIETIAATSFVLDVFLGEYNCIDWSLKLIILPEYPAPRGVRGEAAGWLSLVTFDGYFYHIDINLDGQNCS